MTDANYYVRGAGAYERARTVPCACERWYLRAGVAVTCHQQLTSLNVTGYLLRKVQPLTYSLLDLAAFASLVYGQQQGRASLSCPILTFS
jgi:hypothetical protein